jgi:ribosomal protein L15
MNYQATERKKYPFLTLNSLVKLTKDKKRVGRGPSSGLGKTCGRGYNGALSRTGSARNKEGGQTSIIRRLPKMGFVSLKNKTKKSISAERIFELLEAFAFAAEKNSVAPMTEKIIIDIQWLRAFSIIKGRFDCFKVIMGPSFDYSSEEDSVTDGEDSAVEKNTALLTQLPKEFLKNIVVRAAGFSKRAKAIFLAHGVSVEFTS